VNGRRDQRKWRKIGSRDTGTGELLCEIRDRVVLITLNRRDARNALSDQLTPALRRAIRPCGDDPASAHCPSRVRGRLLRRRWVKSIGEQSC
jgi:hypothetical protein